jgi:hypothetical protein
MKPINLHKESDAEKYLSYDYTKKKRKLIIKTNITRQRVNLPLHDRQFTEDKILFHLMSSLKYASASPDVAQLLFYVIRVTFMSCDQEQYPP